MSNYEILILTKMEVVEATVQKFLTETLKVKDLKIQKLENNELAYPIKKETHANYFLCNTKADPSLITELTRKLNIKKDFLRYLVINLDLEKGLKPKKIDLIVTETKTNLILHQDQIILFQIQMNKLLKLKAIQRL